MSKIKLENKIIEILKISSNSNNIELDSFSILLLVDQLETLYNMELDLADFDIKKAKSVKHLVNYFEKKISDGMGKSL